MKKLLLPLILISIFSCSHNKKKEAFLGNWYSNDESFGFTEFQFFQDSMVISNFYGIYPKKWNIKEDTLILSGLKNSNSKNEWNYKYKFDENMETLELVMLQDKRKLPPLIKAKTAFEFLEKDIGIKIELPQAEDIRSAGNKDYNINVYAGYEADELKVKTDNADDLSNIASEVDSFTKAKREELKPFLKFNLIADRNIPDEQLDSIKNELRQTGIQKIFRTYKTQQIDYSNDLIFVGKFEGQ